MDDTRHIIDHELKLNQLKTDQWVPYKISDKLQWVAEILQELITSQAANIDNTYGAGEKEKISIALKLLRKNSPTYKDHLIMDGKITANYNAACVKCLTPTRVNIDFEFKSVFINTSLQDEPQFEDTEELFVENAERELDFYSKGVIPIKDTLREYLFTGVAHFPIHDEECKGLCKTCGINLNNETCSHNS